MTARNTFVIKLLLLACLIHSARAQQTVWFDTNQHYKLGIELLDKQKYVAAAEQFSCVQKSTDKTSIILDRQHLSLLQENAQYYQAYCALKLGNQNAESLFLEFIKEHPYNIHVPMTYYWLGSSYFEQKNYPKAIQWFEKVKQHDLSAGQDKTRRFKLAYAYFQSKDYTHAKPLFEALKSEESNYINPSKYYFGFISYLYADYRTALHEFNQLKSVNEYQEICPYYIASINFLDKKYDEAVSDAIPMLEGNNPPFEAELCRIVGASYFAKSDYKNAATYYQRFQNKDQGATQSSQDSYQIGYTYYRLNEYTRAIDELEKLNTLDPYFQNAMITLGECFLKTGNKQAARNAFFKAYKLGSDMELQQEGLFNYAKLSYELEFHQVALDAAQEYIKAYPGSKRTDEAKTLLGEILLSTKNYKEAIDILESIPNKNIHAKEAYQKVTYYRGLEFYNERAFPNAISSFLRSNNYPIDAEIEALSTYWMAEAMFEVRKFGESVEKFEYFLTLPAARKTGVYNYANYALAYAAFGNDNYKVAATYLLNFLRGNEKDENTTGDATLRLADAYFALKDYENALRYYNRIIANQAASVDYALFQRGMIEGLQNHNDLKIATHQSLLQQFPASNYADDAGFEIAYTYFVKGDLEQAKAGLKAFIDKYPRSSYVPRALVTIGLVQYDQNQDNDAQETFKRVVKEYPSTDEAKQALESIKNIYLDKSDANGFLTYANSTNIGNLSTAEQDNITFQAANNLFVKGDYQETFEAVNAYFDKFPKPIQEKHARFIRAESLVKLGRPDEAIPDYDFILNDWTSEFTERALISISKVYFAQKKYNEAIVYLKKLELTTEYKANYGFAINYLMEAYSNIKVPDETLKYVEMIRESEKSSEEEKCRASLFAGKAHLLKADTTLAIKELNYAASKTQTITAAESKYLVATLQYLKKDYKASQKTAFELINKMPSYDYWVAKSFILLADNYVALKDIFQAKSTLQSILEHYKGKDDDIIPTAKEKFDQLKNIK
jgi:TolA-binding protein